MLAPFVLNLLIACTMVLLAGWASDAVVRWVGAARRTGTPAGTQAVRRPNWFDREGLATCEMCGMSGDWLFKIDQPVRKS